MKFWKKALIINLKIILILFGIITIFLLTPVGRPIGKTILLVPEVLPWFPVRPLNLLTKKPLVSTIEFAVNGNKVTADIYRPNDRGKHPAMIFTLGILYLKDNPNVVKLAQALTRSGYVVLVPDLPDFETGLIWTDSINSLVALVQYLDSQQYVKKDKIGLVGFCAGGSITIVVAEDQRIADKISYVAAISPYYDGYSLVKAALFKRQDIDGKAVNWNPASLTLKTINVFSANAIEDTQERNLILDYLGKSQQISTESYDRLSPEAQNIYKFIANNNEDKFNFLKDNLPIRLKEVFGQISPSTKIDNFKAKLFMLNDKNDTFVPRSEGLELAKKIPKERIYFIEVDSFEHVNPATKLPRWSILKQIWNVGNYVYNVFSYSS